MSESKPLFSKFWDVLTSESDRAAAVLALAHLDVMTEELFRATLVDGTPESLFHFTGPLGSSSARAELAFALGWLAPEVRDDLTLVRRIRNEFAHDADLTLSFETPSIRDRVRSFKLLAHFAESSALAGLTKQEIESHFYSTPRRKFDSEVALIEMALGKSIRLATKACSPGFPFTTTVFGPVTLGPGESTAFPIPQPD